MPTSCVARTSPVRERSWRWPASRPPATSSMSRTGRTCVRRRLTGVRGRACQRRRAPPGHPAGPATTATWSTGSHDWHAQGRRVAARGHLLRRHGRGRPRTDGQLRHPTRGTRRAVAGNRWSRCRPHRDARERTLAGVPPILHRWQHRDGPVRPVRRTDDLATRRRRTGLHGHHRRRCDGTTAGRRARPQRDAYTTDRLWVIGSGGAILSPTNREQILELLPNRLIADGLGSSETGTVGNKVGQDGATFSSTSRLRCWTTKGRRAAETGWADSPVGATSRSATTTIPSRPPGPSSRPVAIVGCCRAIRPGSSPTVDHAPRPWFDFDQHRRGEGLSRGGRGGPEGPPRWRSRGRRGAGRTLGARVVAVIQPGAGRRPWTHSGPTPAGRWRVTNSRARCSWTTRSSVRGGQGRLGWVERRAAAAEGTTYVCRTARSDAEHPHG